MKPDLPIVNSVELNTSSTLELTNNEFKPNKDQEASAYERNPQREGKYTTSNIGAFLHIVKSSLGSGFLAMPYAFHNAGLLAGLIGTSLVAMLCAHCTHILVKSSQELCYILNKPKLSYSETVEAAFRIRAGTKYSKYTRIARHTMNFFMFFTYYGVNTVYVILIANSFKQVLENHTDIDLNIRWYCVALVIVLLPVGIVRHMKFLVPFSAIANTLLMISFIIIMYYIIIDLPPITSRPMVVEIGKWPLFFSTALFGMEGIGTVMPIENSMKKPNSFLGCPGVLNFGMSVIGGTFIVIGFFGYLRFGEAVEGSISLNLSTNVLSEVIKIFVALSILFTYGLQLTASMEVVWEYVQSNFADEQKNKGYYIVRTLMILGTVVIAVLVPNLSPVLSLVGAFGFSGLGILFPSVVETIVFWECGYKPFQFGFLKNIFLLLIWIVATITGTYSSIEEIITQYRLG
uniref:Amino acid transporter transmembrane domain-containing protein n=1 Tax=Clastoptera arizonana TaxID=38151 RepID=A0A1B6BZR9_9HEMI